MNESNFQHILRVLNTNLDGKVKVMFALTAIKGVGRRFSNIACKKAEVDLNKRCAPPACAARRPAAALGRGLFCGSVAAYAEGSMIITTRSSLSKIASIVLCDHAGLIRRRRRRRRVLASSSKRLRPPKKTEIK